MTELEAFELFRPHGEQNFFLCARKKSIGISKDAFFAMGSPEYALVFFDDVKKRIMVKAVNQNYENAIKIIRHSAGGTHKSSNMAFCCKGLCLKMIELFGISNRKESSAKKSCPCFNTIKTKSTPFIEMRIKN